MTPPVADGLNSELVQIDLVPRRPERKPEWLKARAPGGETFHNLKKLAREQHLHTVCESANCPNLGECWNQKSATFMMPVSYTHLRAHETVLDLVCRLLLEKKKKK